MIPVLFLCVVGLWIYSAWGKGWLGKRKARKVEREIEMRKIGGRDESEVGSLGKGDVESAGGQQQQEKGKGGAKWKVWGRR